MKINNIIPEKTHIFFLQVPTYNYTWEHKIQSEQRFNIVAPAVSILQVI